MFIKRIQLGLIHVAVAITLVPINSTLNRVMIKELAISATLVALLASLPYVFSPLQVAIGSFSDRFPLFGLRRSPYILVGLVLCATGVMVAPKVAFLMADNPGAGILAAALGFGAWGMGYNLSSVSYLALASEISGEGGRGRTVAVMWFMMIVGIIVTAISISQMVEPYSPQALERAFRVVGVAALVLGLVGLFRLESKVAKDSVATAEHYSLKQMWQGVVSNPQARLFFVYLLLLLGAILGQDVLLEPFGAEAFHLTVSQTTRITSLWGVFVLVSIVAAGVLESKGVAKKTVAQMGNLGALSGFIVIAFSGITANLMIFYAGVSLLGIGTGLSTVANLSLMFDLTTAGQVGLFIGAWGFSTALSRMVGSIMAGAVRDIATLLTGSPLGGYLIVFLLEAAMLGAAIIIFTRIDVSAFHSKVRSPSVVERMAMTE